MTIQLPQSISLSSEQLLSLWAFVHVAYGLITHFHWAAQIRSQNPKRNNTLVIEIVAFFVARMLLGFEAKMFEAALWSLCYIVGFGSPWKLKWHKDGQKSVSECVKDSSIDGEVIIIFIFGIAFLVALATGGYYAGLKEGRVDTEAKWKQIVEKIQAKQK